MTIVHGFQLLEERMIKEIKTKARLYRHLKSGAQMLSLSTEDENKVFGITFRTPHADSTGIAHILEHSVLCGSRKYPLKEPFVELLKGSLNTFLNAFTYPDKTCYPVASQNLEDFYNLIDVYLDAVFYPRLTPAVLEQEGWHLEASAVDEPFVFKGVVFNEMKGAYSSPDNVLSEYSLQSLFPGHPYGFDSGGNPRRIPDLTFETFKAFHEKHYHPSNARIFFYGDDHPEARLRFMDAFLRAFDPQKTHTAVPRPAPFKDPGRSIRAYMAGEDETKQAKGMITVNWLLPETVEIETNFALRILEYALLGMPASPLRKTLIESGLGEDLAGDGLGTELRQLYFSTGLKGVATEHMDRVEALIFRTLKDLARKGMDPLTIEAALNTLEFQLRENNTGSFPRGLSLMLRALTTWLYDGDPLALLAFEAPMEKIKARWTSEHRFFEKMLDLYFLNNPHRHTLILKPDAGLGKKEAAIERDRLDETRTAMSPDQVEAVVKNTETLKRKQATPDTPEALATIPVLKRSDLDKKNKTLPLSSWEHGNTPVLFHDIFTNGIAYVDLGFDLHALPDAYLPYVPLFGRALLEMGTETEDFVTLSQRISRKTGGIHPQVFTSTTRENRRSAAWFFLCGKAVAGQVEDMARIFQDVLGKTKLDNPTRFRQILLEEKAKAEEMLIPKGHHVVNLRLRSHFDEAHRIAEQIGGISYLFSLRRLLARVDEDWPKVLHDLEDLRHLLLNRKKALLNVTLDGDTWSRCQSPLEAILDPLPERELREASWTAGDNGLCEGMTIPSQVNYVGKGGNLFEWGYRLHGSALVITRYLRNGWLWDRARVQGGAYGAFCHLDRFSGALTFVSYRDPNLLKTLDVFDQAAQHLHDLDLSREELTKAIIGTIGDLDAPMLPDTKGYASMIRHLTGDSDDLRQKLRDEILNTNASHFKAFALFLDHIREKGIVKILGSPLALEEAARNKPGWLKIFPVM